MKEKFFVFTLLFVLLFIDAGSALICNPTRQFRCKDGECISKRERCDFKTDCKDLSDEENCPKIVCNTTTQFSCTNGKCIPNSWICDDTDDCWDNSDETADLCADHKCNLDQYQCRGTTKCIPIRHKCDGEIDCDKNEDDENDCPKRACRSDEHTCDDGQCIELSFKCDGDRDCKDGSDEKGCDNVICDDTQFACLSKTHCIEASFRCDTISDCPDKSDEANCTYETALCPPHYFACQADGQCIPESWKCNGVPECDDQSDELHCDNIIDRCPFGQVLCKNGRQCILKHKKCDGYRDCIDKSDEENCKGKNIDSGCDSETHFRCAGPKKICIVEHRLCDDFDDCPEKDDEKQGPHFCNYNECQYKNGNCSQICIDKSLGFKCECKPGYKLQEDKKSCEDINECAGKPCDQFCLNTDGSFKCMCRHGYSLAHNGSNCKPIDPEHEVTLIIGDRIRIKKIKLNKALDSDILFSRIKVNSVAVDVAKSQIFWTNPVSETITKSSMSSQTKSEIILNKPDINSPRSVAVDWIHGLIYWIDIGYGTVSVSKQDGTFQKTLFKEANKNLISLSIHPQYGYLYLGYAETKSANGSIVRCSMDGSNCDKIIQQNIRYPNDLTIDYDQDLLYWVDQVLNELASSDLNGNDRKDLVTDSVHHPYSVAVFSGKIYWSDARQHKLFSINRTGGDLTVVDADIGNKVDIAVLHNEAQMPGTDACAASLCKFLCLPKDDSDSEKTYSCVCPDRYTTMEKDPNDCRITVPASTKPTLTKVITKPQRTKSRNPTTTSAQESTTNIVLSTQYAKSAGTQILLGLSIVALILICVLVAWCVFRWKKRKNARLSMNFNNPIYKKVNASVASSSSINGFVEPSPSTSAGDVSRHEDEGTVGLILNEEVPEDTPPSQLRFKLDAEYATVPNGTNETVYFGNSSNRR